MKTLKPPSKNWVNLSVISIKFKCSENHDHAINDVCKDVMCSDYLYEKCCQAALSKALSEIETLNKFEVPESLLPKVVELKGYFVKIKEKLEKADITVEKILAQASGCFRNINWKRKSHQRHWNFMTNGWVVSWGRWILIGRPISIEFLEFFCLFQLRFSILCVSWCRFNTVFPLKTYI